VSTAHRSQRRPVFQEIEPYFLQNPKNLIFVFLLSFIDPLWQVQDLLTSPYIAQRHREIKFRPTSEEQGHDATSAKYSEMTGGKWFRDLCNRFPGDTVLTLRMYLDGTPASNPLGGVSSKPLVMTIGNFDMDLSNAVTALSDIFAMHRLV
jgi:hypothetical protein